MRWNLDINFGQLEDISSSATEYASSMKDLKSALEKFVSVVKDNEGKAVQALQEKPQDLNEALDKNASGLELVSNLLKEFDSTMTGIIAPVSRGSNMQINTVEVKNRLKDLNKLLDNLETTSRCISLPKLGPLPPVEVSNDPKKTAEPSVDRSLYYSVKSKLERMQDVLDDVESSTVSLASSYSQQIETMRKEVEEFEETDNQFENKAEKAWEDYLDLKWYQTTTAKIVLGVVGVAAAIGIVVLGAPAIAIGLATLGVSASASVAIGTGAVILAKGAVVGAIANTAIDVGLAAYNKQDIDSTAGSSLLTGMVTGAVGAGVGAALPGVISKGTTVAKKGLSAVSNMAPGMTAKVTQAGSKFVSTASKVAPGMTAKATQFGQKVVNNAPKIVTKGVSEISEDAAEAAIREDKTFNLRNSTFKAATGEIVGAGTKKIIKNVDGEIDTWNLNDKMKTGAKNVNKSVGNIMGDETKSIVNDLKKSKDESAQNGGSVAENFNHDTNLNNPQKMAKSALKAHKKDSKSLAENGTEKVLDFIENSVKKRARGS